MKLPTVVQKTVDWGNSHVVQPVNTHVLQKISGVVDGVWARTSSHTGFLGKAVGFVSLFSGIGLAGYTGCCLIHVASVSKRSFYFQLFIKTLGYASAGAAGFATASAVGIATGGIGIVGFTAGAAVIGAAMFINPNGTLAANSAGVAPVRENNLNILLNKRISWLFGAK